MMKRVTSKVSKCFWNKKRSRKKIIWQSPIVQENFNSALSYFYYKSIGISTLYAIEIARSVSPVRNFIFCIHPCFNFFNSSWNDRENFTACFCNQNIVFDSKKADKRQLYYFKKNFQHTFLPNTAEIPETVKIFFY